jgi:formylglycine-generating enzyme required for sulfatase activity
MSKIVKIIIFSTFLISCIVSNSESIDFYHSAEEANGNFFIKDKTERNLDFQIQILENGNIQLCWYSVYNAISYKIYQSNYPAYPAAIENWSLIAELDASNQFYEFEPSSIRNFFYLTYTMNVVAPEGFVLVQGGTFSPSENYIVTLSSFFIAQYEVTQSEYMYSMSTNPSYFVGNSHRPVDTVTWFDSIEYCNRRSIMENLRPCYSYSSYGSNPNNWPSNWNTLAENQSNIKCDWCANGYRLPTEMESMFAAMGGIDTNNTLYSGSNNIEIVAWYRSNSYHVGQYHPDFGTHSVGTKNPNELNIYDMTGNVWEYCWDIYGEFPEGSYTNPTGPSTGEFRTSRGGSWYSPSERCLISYRGYGSTITMHYFNGLRVVRNYHY